MVVVSDCKDNILIQISQTEDFFQLVDVDISLAIIINLLKCSQVH